MRAQTIPLVLAAVVLCTAAHAADAGNGRLLYESRCIGCHSPDANRVGPKHRGVVGRAAGSVSSFRYSEALKDSGIVWTPEELDRWLAGPRSMVPGTRMTFSVRHAADRADIIAYLRRLAPGQR
ncbi:MAG: c-type cytochrome [Minwuia sp.]|uniref:c-type cytochrome n=1 Tax=Minwuia sp. TaxID=2493630 RepID=UPI003A88FE98